MEPLHVCTAVPCHKYDLNISRKEIKANRFSSAIWALNKTPMPCGFFYMMLVKTFVACFAFAFISWLLNDGGLQIFFKPFNFQVQ